MGRKVVYDGLDDLLASLPRPVSLVEAHTLAKSRGIGVSYAWLMRRAKALMIPLKKGYREAKLTALLMAMPKPIDRVKAVERLKEAGHKYTYESVRTICDRLGLSVVKHRGGRPNDPDRIRAKIKRYKSQIQALEAKLAELEPVPGVR